MPIMRKWSRTFSGVGDADARSGETGGQRGVKFSFANLLHIHRPLMIVDEAHNAVTGLTREMQTRVNPGAIIEFTATPPAQVEHPVQRHRSGTETRGHD